jgi:hypothetical protein
MLSGHNFVTFLFISKWVSLIWIDSPLPGEKFLENCAVNCDAKACKELKAIYRAKHKLEQQQYSGVNTTVSWYLTS